MARSGPYIYIHPEEYTRQIQVFRSYILPNRPAPMLINHLLKLMDMLPLGLVPLHSTKVADQSSCGEHDRVPRRYAGSGEQLWASRIGVLMGEQRHTSAYTEQGHAGEHQAARQRSRDCAKQENQFRHDVL